MTLRSLRASALSTDQRQVLVRLAAGQKLYRLSDDWWEFRERPRRMVYRERVEQLVALRLARFGRNGRDGRRVETTDEGRAVAREGGRR